MRRRPSFWVVLSLLCFGGAAYFWWLGDQWGTTAGAPRPVPGTQLKRAVSANPSDSVAPPPTNSTSPSRTVSSVSNSYRLSNTSKTIGQLAHQPDAILLENALIDTTALSAVASGSNNSPLPIPNQLRAQGDPGAYLVQSRGPLDDLFRRMLRDKGAGIVSYIPNSAYLVRATEAVARMLAQDPQTQTVLAYEPYYKLRPFLLALAVEGAPLPEGSLLNLLLFPDEVQSTTDQLEQLGANVLAHEQTPFGPMLRVHAPTGSLTVLARLPGVQQIELARARVPANDLSRATLGVAPDSVSTNNYLDLTGKGILVNINDTGVDKDHPDLTGRVSFDFALSGTDTNGHGTHVAGIIAGNGASSEAVSNAPGSFLPDGHGAPGQFRGMAPEAALFSMRYGASDTYLQTMAAKTGLTNSHLPLISANGWNYDQSREYDLPAASYDAAVPRRASHRDGFPAAALCLSRGQCRQRNGLGRWRRRR